MAMQVDMRVDMCNDRPAEDDVNHNRSVGNLRVSACVRACVRSPLGFTIAPDVLTKRNVAT